MAPARHIVDSSHLSNAGSGATVKKPIHVDGFGTRAIHVGSEPNPSTGAVIPPISLSTTYKQEAIGVHKVCTLLTLHLFASLTV